MNKLLLLIIACFAAGFGFMFLYKKKYIITVSPQNTYSSENNAVAKPEVSERAAVSGTPLVTINGKTLISVESLKTEKEKIFAANPQLQKLSSYMGEKELERNLLQGLMSQSVMSEYITRNNIHTTPEYKAELASAMNDVERMINTKFFTQKFNPQVTSADISKFYEENKAMMPNAIISRGGIMTKEINFSTESEAKNCLEKIKSKNFNILTALKELNIDESKVKDLKLVNEQSTGIDNAIKTATAKMNKFPTAEIIKTMDNKFSVIIATAKENPKYQPLNDQIKNDIKTYLERSKQAEIVDAEIEKLKNDYGIVVDLAYFGPLKETNPELTPEMLDIIEQEESEEGILPNIATA